jgi:hypothetical protein
MNTNWPSMQYGNSQCISYNVLEERIYYYKNKWHNHIFGMDSLGVTKKKKVKNYQRDGEKETWRTERRWEVAYELWKANWNISWSRQWLYNGEKKNLLEIPFHRYSIWNYKQHVEGSSESYASYFNMSAHGVRSWCWWYGNRGWTLAPIVCKFRVLRQRAAEEQSGSAFQQRRHAVRDRPRSGQPCTAVSSRNEERLDQKIRANRHKPSNLSEDD